MEGPYTYCPGPRFSVTEPITTRNIGTIIEVLTSVFGEGYEFQPEPISEGGIIMTKWPGKEGFKTIRFNFGRQTNSKWPWVTDGAFAGTTTIWDKVGLEKYKGGTYLKAFYGAPVWTPEEVQHVVHAFDAAGFVCLKSSIPGKKKLRETGLLGKKIT